MLNTSRPGSRVIVGYMLMIEAELGLIHSLSTMETEVHRGTRCANIFGGQANRLDKSNSMPGNDILSREEKRVHRMEVCGQVCLAVRQKIAGRESC